RIFLMSQYDGGIIRCSTDNTYFMPCLSTTRNRKKTTWIPTLENNVDDTDRIRLATDTERLYISMLKLHEGKFRREEEMYLELYDEHEDYQILKFEKYHSHRRQELLKIMSAISNTYQPRHEAKFNIQVMNYGDGRAPSKQSAPLYQQPFSSRSIPVQYQPNSSSQQYNIPPSLYVQNRSTNPVPNSMHNQPQYTSSQAPYNFQTAKAIKSEIQPAYFYNRPGEQQPLSPPFRMKPINPSLVSKTGGSSSPSLVQPKGMGYASAYAKKEPRGEIDDAPIIDPSAFRYLNMKERKAQKKTDDIEQGIDDRPIINLDAVQQLERRRQHQLNKKKKDDDIVGIDDRPIVNLDSFRYIENKREGKKNQEDQGPHIDTRPITNPDAFKYLENKRQPKVAPDLNEPLIDTRSIVNPDAFRYLERKPEPKLITQSGIDHSPIVNPNAFRYIEQAPQRKPDIESGIDYKPMVNPAAFKYLERKEPQRKIEGPEVDERSYVNPNAFRYIERRPPPKSDHITSEIDTRSYLLNPNALAHIEKKFQKCAPPIESGIDRRGYVNPDAFKYIERPAGGSPREKQGPLIDTTSYLQNPNALAHLERKYPTKNDQGGYDVAIDDRPYVNLESFRHLQQPQQGKSYEKISYEGVDETSFVDPDAFRHLEFKTEENQFYSIPNYSDL
ncbi:unnamed protein product, partial [Didymodactylos carnosus]